MRLPCQDRALLGMIQKISNKPKTEIIGSVIQERIRR